MKIILPMAGRGSRYSDHGYQTPKPLIEVGGKPMLFWALDGLLTMPFSEMIVVVLEVHETRYGVSAMIRKYLEKARRQDLENTVSTLVIPEVTDRKSVV